MFSKLLQGSGSSVTPIGTSATAPEPSAPAPRLSAPAFGPSDTLLSTHMKRRRSHSVKTKLEVIQMVDQGKTVKEISLETGLHEKSIHGIKKRRVDVMETASRISAGMADKVTRRRNVTLERMEALLHEWIVKQTEKDVCMSPNTIKSKATSLFNAIATETNAVVSQNFTASSGWLKNFRKRCGLNNVKLQEECANTDHYVVPGFIQDFSNVMKEGDFPPGQSFNWDGMGLFSAHGPSAPASGPFDTSLTTHKKLRRSHSVKTKLEVIQMVD